MEEVEGERGSATLQTCRQVVHPLLVSLAGFCLTAYLGWTGKIEPWVHACTVGSGILFAAERLWVFRCLRVRWRERRRLSWHAVLAVLVLLMTAALILAPMDPYALLNPAGYIFILLSVLVSGLASMIHHQTRFTARAFHPGAVLIGSFFFIIISGALLLKMPLATVPGQSCTWLDALFTSTSAVCVTGLTVQNTATFFSGTGQTIILILIQVGGLGIMTLTFFAAVVLFEGLSLHDRLLLGKMIQENRLARIGRTLAFIMGMTVVCETVGALVLYQGLQEISDTGERWFQSVFHSVSAFCNAGFSTFPDGLAGTEIKGNLTWQGCIMGLVVVGGLGSLVNEDVSIWAVNRVRRIFRPAMPVARLRVHTRLVLTVTAFLVVAGAGIISLTEFVFWEGPQNSGGFMTALFHSITARTAGFNTVPMGQIGPLTVQVLMVLMLIGGSPGGTAGGLRTTVVCVGLGYLWNQLRGGRRGMVVFRRTIPRETGARALGLMVLAGLWLGVNFILLQLMETGSGVAETTLLFELVSAFATVGLSLDLTPVLSAGGKTILIINMFIGRIGLLTVMATLIPPDRRPVSGRPAEDVLLT